MNVDIIMPADTSKRNLSVMTDLAIKSCIRSEPGINFQFYIIDQNKHTSGFRQARTIIYDGEFNYNHCLNIGISLSNSPIVALCNNDLLFSPGWMTKILKYFDNYSSASPNNKQTTRVGCREGYRIEKDILGWCIVCTRKLLKKIGGLDETCKFWYSDNIYAEQIKRAGYKHILIYESYVKHLGSKTLIKKNHRSLTRDQAKLFRTFLNKIEK